MPYQCYKTNDAPRERDLEFEKQFEEQRWKENEGYGFLVPAIMIFGYFILSIISADNDIQNKEYLRKSNYSIEQRVEDRVNDNVGSFIGRVPHKSNP